MVEPLATVELSLFSAGFMMSRTIFSLSRSERVETWLVRLPNVSVRTMTDSCLVTCLLQKKKSSPLGLLKLVHAPRAPLVDIANWSGEAINLLEARHHDGWSSSSASLRPAWKKTSFRPSYAHAQLTVEA